MNLLILAAGKGSRLGSLSAHTPKPLVPLRGTPLLDYQLVTARQCGLRQVNLVTGYQAEAFAKYNLRSFHNAQYKNTNMLYSLMCARELMRDEDLVISYGDIIYTPEVLQAVIDNPHPMVVSADTHWRELWQLRMEDPLSDAETFKYDARTNLLHEIGKPLSRYADAQAQYIGLIKIRADLFPVVMHIYETMSEKQRASAFFTDFVQRCIAAKLGVFCQCHKRQWLEVDTPEDLETYQTLIKNNDMATLGFPNNYFNELPGTHCS